jgi:putative ABC transport system permease protein
MPLWESVMLALNTIRVQKLKSVFTLMGVTIAVMFLIAVVSIVEGMSKYVEEDFMGRMLGANTYTLRRIPWFSGASSNEEWRLWLRRPRIYPRDARLVRDVSPPGTRWAIESQDLLWAQSQYVRPRQVEAHAVDGDYFNIKKYDLSSGRVFSPQEMELGSNVVVIGDETAKYFFPTVDAIGREIRIGAIPYTVIGVIEHQGNLFGQSLDKTAIAPFNSPLRKLTNPRGDVDGVMVQASTPMILEDAMEATREALRSNRHMRPSEPDNFVMETTASAMGDFKETMNVMTIAGTALPAIGLVVGGLVIMNIMLVAVAERTREIGIRKSLGARRRDILSQFLVEAATLSTVGALAGIALGLLGAKVIEANTPLPAAVAPWSIVMATVLGLVVGVISGVYPARRASMLDPIEALRQET